MVDITKRSVKGSPLTNDEVDTNFDNLNTGKVGVEDIGTDPNQVPLNQYLGSMAYQDLDAVSITGGTVVVDELSLGDNAKAIFGAGSDLQIYSDGENSILKENGGGNLIVNADNLNIVNSADTEYKAKFNTDGSVQLYYDNAEKFSTTATGIDVTGTVTADGLTVDTGGSAVEFNHSATGPTLRFNNTDLTVADGQQLARIEFSTDDTGVTTDEVYLQLTGDGTGGAAFFDIMTGDGTPTKTARFNVGGDISFYEDTGTTAKFFWDASTERLGIGTTSPDTVLHVGESTNSATVEFRLFNSEGNVGIATNNGSLIFVQNSGSETMRITSTGNVGIGTTSPDAALTVVGGGVAEFRAGNIGPSANSAIRVSRNDTTVTTGNPLGYLEFGGNDSTSNVDTAFAYVGAEAEGLHSAGDNPTGLVFGVTADNSGTPAEVMRIDSDGNLLVGKTAAGVNTDPGFYVAQAGNFGSTVDGTTALYINRQTSDGDLIELRKDGTTVGAIATEGGELVIGTGDTGLRFLDASSTIIPRETSGGSADNKLDLGSIFSRFKNLYLTGGVYLGGTVAANLLDDYEEGTWTPVVSDANTGGNTATGTFSGSYVKVGKLVTVQCVLFNIDTTGMTAGNILYIQGFPFTTTSTNSSYVSPALQNTSFTGQPLLVLGDLRSYAYLREFSSGGTFSNLIVSDFTSGSADVFFVLQYEAA